MTPEPPDKERGDQIAPALAPLVVPIDSVQLHPRNPRDGDVGAISESLRRFGQQKPIVVQASTGFVVAGNHLLKAARALGWRRIAANVEDMDDATAGAYLLADNRTADLGSYHADVLAAILEEQAAAGNLAGTGYDGEDVDQKIADAQYDRDPGRGLGNPVISYTIVFDDEQQQEQWYRFLKWLKRELPDAETFGERISAWLGDFLASAE